jgi:Flp pilus assembly protein TadG
MKSRIAADASPRGASRLRDERGAAAVEFALVLPLLVVILFGILEFGRALHISHVVTDAAREGARRAVVRDGQNKQTTVPDVVQARLASAGLTWNRSLTGYAASCAGWTLPAGSTTAIVVSGCGWGGTAGTDARVAIRAPFPFEILRPLLRVLPGSSTLNPVTLTGNLVMRNE